MLGKDGKPLIDKIVTEDKDGRAKNETVKTGETKKNRKKKLEREEIAKEEEKITTALTQVINIR